LSRPRARSVDRNDRTTIDHSTASPRFGLLPPTKARETNGEREISSTTTRTSNTARAHRAIRTPKTVGLTELNGVTVVHQIMRRAESSLDTEKRQFCKSIRQSTIEALRQPNVSFIHVRLAADVDLFNTAFPVDSANTLLQRRQRQSAAPRLPLVSCSSRVCPISTASHRSCRSNVHYSLCALRRHRTSRASSRDRSRLSS
jgi:hypothetical protein